jgi:hypothetical protein
LLSASLIALAATECDLRGQAQIRLSTLDVALKNKPGYWFAAGLIYTDGQCYADAHGAFANARRENVSPEELRILKNNTEGMDHVVDGYAAFARGDSPTAVVEARKALDASLHPEVVMRSGALLTMVARRNSDAGLWRQIEPELLRLGGAPIFDWGALFELRTHQQQTGSGDEAIADTLAELDAGAGPQRRLHLLLLALSLLHNAKRDFEAALLLRSIEEPEGLELLNRNLRRLFYSLAAEIEAAQFKRTNDSEAGRRAGLYETAASAAAAAESISIR